MTTELKLVVAAIEYRPTVPVRLLNAPNPAVSMEPAPSTKERMMSKFQVSIQRVGSKPELHDVDSLVVAGELLAASLDACAVVRGPGSYTSAGRIVAVVTHQVTGVLYVTRHLEGCACEASERKHFGHMVGIAWDYDAGAWGEAEGTALCPDGSLVPFKARTVRGMFPNPSYWMVQTRDETSWNRCGDLPKETVVPKRPASVHANFLSMLGAE